ncbi:hypothetical protein CS367_17085 [Serratia marcescens]|nr:beta-ketoacyl synthase N-terminal-like domain-containing protein [Serratia marcescens]PIC09685.1 hypothetical protein CS367_17085 [Serratia marcescens]
MTGHMHGDNFLTDPYFGAGSSSSITSNRMSYLLGLTGPSMTLDTACSSSLVAVDLAVEKLRNGVCSAALVGGVNVMLSHRSFVGCSASKMLSQKGVAPLLTRVQTAIAAVKASARWC